MELRLRHLLWFSLLLLLLDLSHGGSQIRFLPGFQGPLPFYLETGYIGVEGEENVQLFYYFVKSSGPEPEKSPLIFWFTGGPGCSVLSAFFYEIGPLSFNLSTRSSRGFPRLALNPYSWTQEANILFLDSPVGTGFSYGKTDEATYTTREESCQQAYAFLQKWLLNHTEFVLSPVYVAGDSYSGTTVPVIAKLIADGNELGATPRINLTGYLLGNPLTFQAEDNYQIPFAYGMGIIPPDLYESLEASCNGNYTEDANRILCSRDLRTFQEMMAPLDENNVFEPVCPFAATDDYSDQRRFLSQTHWEIRCRNDVYRFSAIWANDPAVRESLNIRQGSRETWIRCNYDINSTTEVPNMLPYHKNLTSRGYRSLIYSGHLDARVTTLSTIAWISSLNSPVVDEWRPWLVGGQASGYTRSFENQMTYATVWGAGHIAPEYRPRECHAMFERWISKKPL